MANAKLGGKASYGGGAFVEKLDSDRVLTLGDSGKVFMLANSGAISVTFPDISAMNTQEKESAIGWNATFICQQTLGGAATVGCSSGDGNLLFGSSVGGDGSAATGLDAVADDINFTTGTVAGDMAKVIYDGTYYYGWAQSADAAHITLD
tara:strand:- start:116 stop:565 length:450 start_codon:yes stop_codon:yes gene_type:complete